MGRTAERALFDAVLAGEEAAAVLWVHGPGGIGKSALLDRFAEAARAAVRPVVRVEGRRTDPVPGAYADAVAGALGQPGVVVLADTFERAGDAVEDWFRRDFVPRLPEDAVVVVAGRRAPAPGWRADSGFGGLLRVIGLRELPPGDAAALLDARGAPFELRERLLAFAGGHPLALALGAQAGPGASDPAGWVPGHDVIRTLLAELVGSVPSPAHRHVLEICAHAYDTTEELLRSVLDEDEDAGALFDWLRGQPFAESGPGGVYPHDLVRDVLDADLRWRDPRGYEAMHRGIRRHLLERVRSARGPEVPRTLGALSFLHRHGGVMPDFVTWRRQDDVHEDGAVPGDRAALRALAARAEGAESARLVDFWFTRSPEAFHVYRRGLGEEPVAFMVWLRLAAPDDAETGADPVVAAAWEHSRAAGPVRAGEHLALARFMVDPAAYQRPSPVTDLVQMRILSEWLRATRPAWSYLVVADPKFWEAQMDYLDQHLVPGEVVVGDRTFRLYAHDWRAVPVGSWLDRHAAQELFGPRARTAHPRPDLVVLSREQFGAAVREALRSWRRPDRFGAGPLTRGRLVADADGEPAEALRRVLAEAVEVLAHDPGTARLHRALVTTYFRSVPTQEAAAERLGLPLSTYRRHLSQGIEEVCDILWSREVYGTAGE
ncbi:ATP-binding protein [Streptomyces sp. NPDC047002]|uniref:ATP-binding protein n=1 Tax=Streptomyces sp. NPDC047002 TaxID=3155475 RepID=UPI0034531309